MAETKQGSDTTTPTGTTTQPEIDVTTQPEIDVYTLLQKPYAKKQVREADPRDPSTDNNVIHTVDAYYDTLESARQALWETLSANDAYITFFDVPAAIARITRKMAILRLKRLMVYHEYWSPASASTFDKIKNVKEHIPYWKDVVGTDRRLSNLIVYTQPNFLDRLFKDSHISHQDMIDDKRIITDILRARNDNPNNYQSDNRLRDAVQRVVHYYIDNLESPKPFLRELYSIITGKANIETGFELISFPSETEYLLRNTDSGNYSQGQLTFGDTVTTLLIAQVMMRLLDQPLRQRYDINYDNGQLDDVQGPSDTDVD